MEDVQVILKRHLSGVERERLMNGCNNSATFLLGRESLDDYVVLIRQEQLFGFFGTGDGLRFLAETGPTDASSHQIGWIDERNAVVLRTLKQVRTDAKVDNTPCRNREIKVRQTARQIAQNFGDARVHVIRGDTNEPQRITGFNDVAVLDDSFTPRITMPIAG